jgi:hypothetical protein
MWLPCSWENEEEMIGENLMELEQAKIGTVVLDDDVVSWVLIT